MSALRAACLLGLAFAFQTRAAFGQYYTQEPYNGRYVAPAGQGEAAVDRRATKCCELKPLSADGEFGMSFVDLRTLGVDVGGTSAAVIPTRAVGPMAGIGAGAYLGQLGFGVRGRVASFDAPLASADRWQIWSANAELSIRVPMDRFVPRLGLGAGYTAVSGLSDAQGLFNELDIDGFNVRALAALDVFIVPAVSLGAALSGEIMILSREGVPSVEEQRLAATDHERAVALAEESEGSSLGGALTLSAVARVHF